MLVSAATGAWFPYEVPVKREFSEQAGHQVFYYEGKVDNWPSKIEDFTYVFLEMPS
jgi:hypothetical protein